MSSLELQRSIINTLKNDAGVAALVGDRVFDNPPTNPTFPYISIGPDQTLQNRADCGYDGSEITIQLDAWSRSMGFREVKQIAEAMRRALVEDSMMPLNGHRLIDIAIESINTLRDPDGLTSHAAATFRALTEPI